MRRGLAVFVVFLPALLAACAQGTRPVGDLATLSCDAQLAYIDALVAQNGVRNASASPVAGFAYLRANRNSVLLARQLDEDGDGQVDQPDRWRDFIAQTRGLDRDARQSEMANLPVASGISFDQIEACASTMAASLMPDQYPVLSAAVFVPDDYLDFQRIAGLYPITAFAAYFGYEGWKQENFASFEQRSADIAALGKWYDYLVPDQTDDGFNDITLDAFGLLQPTGAELEKLARAYAPIFRVRTGSESDKVGQPSLPTRDALAVVDTDHPNIYYRLSHTYFAGKWRPQIVYEIWFPERPATSRFDILAGHFDALVWRVTLDDDGAPLTGDTIHGCGCYHMFFPSNRLQRINAPEDNDIRETAEMPAGYVDQSILRRPVLWIDETSHYLLKLTDARGDKTAGEFSAQDASLRPARDLSQLPLQNGQGTASLFDEDGFVPGTERLEWILLWPMGVEKPGAMRQWGHHATAFVGRRHFDEPDLMDRYFTPR